MKLLSVTTQQAGDDVIAEALSILYSRLRQPGRQIKSPLDAKNYLTLRLGELPHEVFGVMWLDALNRIISFDEIFRGGVTSTKVYLGEIAKNALKANAVNAILSHNHPSGGLEPSPSDRDLTREVFYLMKTIDVNVVDHIIVAGVNTYSFAEHGIMPY